MRRMINLFTTTGLLLLMFACGKDLGIVQGVVRFEGVPCQEGQTDFNVPPCSGGYQGYEIIVYKSDNLLTPVLETTSGENGSFRVILPAGDYVIRAQNGPDKRNDLKNYPFTIEKNKVTPLDVTVRRKK